MKRCLLVAFVTLAVVATGAAGIEAWLTRPIPTMENVDLDPHAARVDGDASAYTIPIARVDAGARVEVEWHLAEDAPARVEIGPASWSHAVARGEGAEGALAVDAPVTDDYVVRVQSLAPRVVRGAVEVRWAAPRDPAALPYFSAVTDLALLFAAVAGALAVGARLVAGRRA